MSVRRHLIHVKSNQLMDGSTTEPKSPNAIDLSYGEIAINYLKDKERMFIKNSDDDIVPFYSGKVIDENEAVTAQALSVLDGRINDIEESVKEVSVLWVGNSLTQDAVSYLPLVLKEIAPNLNFRFYIWYDGGATLANILTKWNNNTAAEIFSTCENVTSWTNSTSTTMSAFLNTGKTFDIVSIEEYFNYKRETGYTDDQKQDFNRIIEYLRNNYQHPFKVAAYFHRPLCKNSSGQLDLSVADKVYGLTYDGVRWQMENTIAETVIPTGIAAYRAMYDSALNGLGQKGYMTPDYTHSQEGLPCLMQAWVVALWLFEQMGMPVSINNAQTRVTNANYSSIHVPGANLGNGVVVGTTAQDRTAMNVAIKAYKEGKKLESGSFSPYGIPAYDIVINGLSGTQTEREVQLSASYLPADASVSGVNWSILSGDATVGESGLVKYTGSNRNASVSVRATAKNSNLYTDGVLTYALSSVETPIIRPTSGEYGVGEAITIVCMTSGAQIYYTTDGSTPTNNSTLYTAPITLNSNMTVKAIAYKDGESSNVATASYTVLVSHQISINVYDGVTPVSDATVTLERNGSVYQPTESSGGTYVFSVASGNYKVSASAQDNELYYKGEITVDGTVSSFSISLIENPITNMLSGTIIPPLPVYAYIAKSTGAFCQHHEQNNRSCVVIPRIDATNPITWSSSSSGSTEEKAAYSMIEFNPEYPVVTAKVTNTDYDILLSIGTETGGIFVNNDSWCKESTIVCGNSNTKLYISLEIRKADDSDFTTQPTFEEMGLSLIASALTGESIDLVSSGNIMVSPLPLYAFAAKESAATQTSNGNYLQNFTYNTRSSVVALRENTTHPCTWLSASSASSTNRNLYTLYELNPEYPYVSVDIANADYQADLNITTNDTTVYFVSPTGWVNHIIQEITYNGTLPIYLTIMLRKADNGTFSNTPTFEEMGLSIKQYKRNINV